jgi:lycopene cyclase domain-containing protein
MTYFEFLFYFLFLPILLLWAVQLSDKRRARAAGDFSGGKAAWLAIAVQISLALIYTTPWDNYLVATGVWYYNPALVTGIVFGYVPLEEYTFFILQTLFVGLWWWFLAQRITSPAPFNPSPKLRLWSSALLAIVWLVSTVVFFGSSEPWTYLSITLLWALPPIIIQCAFGADILWHHRKLVLATILPLGLFLSVADSIAISATTWTISPAQSLGIFYGRLPLEEGLFFFITVTLATFGLMLMQAQESQGRARDITRRVAEFRDRLRRAGPVVGGPISVGAGDIALDDNPVEQEVADSRRLLGED